MLLPTLSQLARFPSFVDWLRELDDAGPSKRTEWADLQVLEARLKGSQEPGEESVHSIDAKVGGIQGRQFRVRVFLYYDDRAGCYEDDWFSECGCAEMVECKHARAVLAALRGVVAGTGPAGPRLSPSVNNWLTHLRSAQQGALEQAASRDQPPKPNTRFLAYCIEPDHRFRSPGYRLVLRVGNRGKAGISIQKSLAEGDPVRPANYMAPEDIAICAAYHARRLESRSWGDGLPLVGGGWESLLFPALATGRLFSAHSWLGTVSMAAA
ncbi:MAG: hypothetical protein MUF04_11775 [Akkermansiaceae bacterium]|nr:hypothetical protein [Akkermansiaceae bacterium]